MNIPRVANLTYMTNLPWEIAVRCAERVGRGVKQLSEIDSGTGGVPWWARFKKPVEIGVEGRGPLEQFFGKPQFNAAFLEYCDLCPGTTIGDAIDAGWWFPVDDGEYGAVKREEARYIGGLWNGVVAEFRTLRPMIVSEHHPELSRAVA